jgi:enamine deaminase RidA (YjgF/YER057c/UK114 family)
MGARQDATVIMPERENVRKLHEQWGFAEAVVAGDTVYLSGVVTRLKAGESDMEAAYERTFATIGDVLTRAGVSWDDVVELTSYHTDVVGQADAIIKVKNRHVRPPLPAWTAIEVRRLIPDDGITEIRVIAKTGVR